MSEDEFYEMVVSVFVGVALIGAGVFDEYLKKRRG
jgi:hypothetical protein